MFQISNLESQVLYIFGVGQLSLPWPHPPFADHIRWVLNLDSAVSGTARFGVLPLRKLSLVWLHMCRTGKEITFPWLITQLPIRPQGACHHSLPGLTLITSSAYLHCMNIKIPCGGNYNYLSRSWGEYCVVIMVMYMNLIKKYSSFYRFHLYLLKKKR